MTTHAIIGAGQVGRRLAEHLREWGRDEDADQWKAYRKQLKQ